jgi:Protein of unknown function (DUF3761)
MKRPLTAWCVAGMVALATSICVAHTEAQAPKAKPAGATAECKDGSYSTAKTERGACSGHGGIATWFATTKDATKTTAAKSGGQAPATETKSVGTPGLAVAKSAGNAPANATGQCKDGTYTTASSKRGACSGHGGLATWLADAPRGKTPAQTQGTPRSAAADRPPTAAAAPATAAPPTATARTQAPPADAPQNATAQCNDGTYSFAKQHSGACSRHKGVKIWFK